MTADRDTTRVVRSWLRTDEHESADRILDTVLSRLDATPQRRSWWPPRRFPDMQSFAKLAFAAAAVVLVAVVAINLSSGSGIGGKPTVVPSPTASPAAAVPTASATPPRFPRTGPLAVGRHSMTLAGATFTFALATTGWSSNGEWGIDKHDLEMQPDGAGFIFWNNDANGVFSDPCAGVKAPEVGPSAAELATAIAGMPSIELVSGPTAVAVGGKPAQKVVIRIPDKIGCPPEQFDLWYDTASADNFRYASQAGQTLRVWIIEVNGARIQIDAETFAGAGAAPGNEIQAIIDSIRFE